MTRHSRIARGLSGLLAAALSSALLIAPVRTSADPNTPLIELKVTLVEMPIATAVAGGLVGADLLDPNKQTGTQLNIFDPADFPTATPLEQLAAQGAARILSSGDFGLPAGETAVVDLMVPAPFEIKEPEQAPDEEPWFAAGFPGKVGLAIKLTPELSESGAIHLALETAFRSEDAASLENKHRLIEGGYKVTLQLKPGTALSVADFNARSDREQLASLPGMAQAAEDKPYFSPPTPGWVLMYVVVPSLIEDN